MAQIIKFPTRTQLTLRRFFSKRGLAGRMQRKMINGIGFLLGPFYYLADSIRLAIRKLSRRVS